jgi:diguanylate cyclase (GGDEF)-like protein
MMTIRLTLTIFQKMLIAPLAGVLLYSAYLFNIYDEQKINRQSIEQIRSLQLPVMGLASENVRLFATVAAKFKDAVLANEQEWVSNTRKERDQIESNLVQLARYAPIVAPDELATVQGSFARYYDNAFALAQAMLRGDAGSEESNRLIENVERYHRLVAGAFKAMHAELYARFSQRIDEINERLQRQVIIAAALGIALIAVIAGLTFVISLSTRNALREVNAAFRNMAQEKPDFSRRLCRASNDELGELIGWFNLLADQLEANYKQIEQLSIVDKLTQLFNRAKIDELLHLEIGKARRQGSDLTIIIIDLDHFKEVNDTFGHLAGDTVLRELADLLPHSVRSTDHVGRWGGEEFIVLLPDTDLANGHQLAEKLRTNIASFDFSVVGHKTACFGVAGFRDGDDEDALIKRADDCLYAAKHQGRNRVVDETELA